MRFQEHRGEKALKHEDSGNHGEKRRPIRSIKGWILIGRHFLFLFNFDIMVFCQCF